MGDANALQVTTLLLMIFVTLGGTYLLLSQGPYVLKLFGRTGLNVMTRIMGLLVAVIAVQFVLEGLRPVLVEILRS
jgi:multiple antibiotic resistance protein